MRTAVGGKLHSKQTALPRSIVLCSAVCWPGGGAGLFPGRLLSGSSSRAHTAQSLQQSLRGCNPLKHIHPGRIQWSPGSDGIETEYASIQRDLVSKRR